MLSYGWKVFETTRKRKRYDKQFKIAAAQVVLSGDVKEGLLEVGKTVKSKELFARLGSEDGNKRIYLNRVKKFCQFVGDTQNRKVKKEAKKLNKGLHRLKCALIACNKKAIEKEIKNFNSYSMEKLNIGDYEFFDCLEVDAEAYDRCRAFYARWIRSELEVASVAVKIRRLEYLTYGLKNKVTVYEGYALSLITGIVSWFLIYITNPSTLEGLPVLPKIGFTILVLICLFLLSYVIITNILSNKKSLNLHDDYFMTKDSEIKYIKESLNLSKIF